MEPEVLKEELKNLIAGVEKKSAEQIKEELKEYNEKVEALIAQKSKELVGKEFKAFETSIKDELKTAVEGLQEHLDKLDVKLQGGNGGNANETTIKSLIAENSEQIFTVRKGHAVKIDVKAVGDMTLTNNLTGDQPREYSFDVSSFPGQMVNVADLVGLVTISGGTYTFPKETGGEGGIGSQTEGALKNQKDYDLEMVDCNTDFIAGFAVYSKKMRNNLPFLESWLPQALRRDYWKSENNIFQGVLASDATASTVTAGNKIERLIAEIARLEDADYTVNGITVRPSDYWDILITEKSTGAGYGLPGVVTVQNGVLRVNGIPVFKATWLPANKYYVGDWSRVKKVVTQGLSLQFSEEDSDNFRKNNITARIESQTNLCLERPESMIYGDFTSAP